MAGITHTKNYQPQQFEARWQQLWEEQGLHLALGDRAKPKFYCLDFFPYPSGDGLHVGHCRNYVPTDVISRYKRMRGFDVLHPMGWDAFGEPAEQFAQRHGVHPRVTTDRNTANFRRQMRLIGASYDWSREINSSDPAYYRWTQAFFLLLHQRGLAYRDLNWQWWCPDCQTTLSSHEVKDGVCWRGHSGVTRRQIPAWYFRITDYADRLLEGLERIDWPESVKTMQRSWIGRSEGAQIIFPFKTGQTEGVEVFTTRPDTLLGVTFLALAPEHPLLPQLTGPEQSEAVTAYVEQARRFSEVERMLADRPKTGVFSGGYVSHPLTGAEIPIWVADYVLPGYGTGAVMGVPAHDERDFAFARHYDLPLRYVISPDGGEPEASAAYTGEGVMIHAPGFDGLPNSQAAAVLTEILAKHQLGKATVQYRMRDWLISRQRYWGAPIPIIHCPACGEVPVPEDQLPVLLPPMENFAPDGSGQSPLARLPEFVNTTCPYCGGAAKRETDTMGGFACSSWYFLRFASPHVDDVPYDLEAVRYWLPVDLYVGGTEHAVLHLLYSRFWVKVMYDAGLLPFDEPFQKLVNQGQLMGPDGKRMSKSRGNVITPDSVVAEYGADALRLYGMFMAPFEQEVTWSVKGITSSWRFLNRVWNLLQESYAESAACEGEDVELERWRQRSIRKVGERIENLRFNIMVSALMEFVNVLLERRQSGEWRTASYHQALDTLLTLLAPAAPFISEELWQACGHSESVHRQPWPVYDPELARDPVTQIAVQVNGKLRFTLDVAEGEPAEAVQQAALADPRLQRFIEDRQVERVIYVPGRICNIVLT